MPVLLEKTWIHTIKSDDNWGGHCTDVLLGSMAEGGEENASGPEEGWEVGVGLIN